MGGYGSGRRSARNATVEESRSVDTSLFRTVVMQRASALITWRNSADEVISSLGYTSDHRETDSTTLRFSYTVGADERQREVAEPVQLVATQPFFGGRRWWFICPLIVNGQVCQRRVRKLYLPPGGTYFGCRHCYSLTYESVRTHDNRVGRLLRSPDAILAAPESKNYTAKFLGLRAYCKLRGFP